MASIKLRGREIPLLYTTWEMKQVQEEIAPIGRFLPLLMGISEEDGDRASLFATAEHLEALGKTIRIMGNAALEEAGQEPDLTDKWVMRALRPANLTKAMNACVEAINEGMASEIPEEKPEGPVDVTLEAMQKKKELES